MLRFLYRRVAGHDLIRDYFCWRAQIKLLMKVRVTQSIILQVLCILEGERLRSLSNFPTSATMVRLTAHHGCQRFFARLKAPLQHGSLVSSVLAMRTDEGPPLIFLHKVQRELII